MQPDAIRVLVVDDEPDSYAIINLMLSRQHVHPVEICLHAIDLSQAQSLIKRWHPDWIIVDLDLTEAHGFSIVELLSDGDNAELTFITAHEPEAADILVFSEICLLQKPLNKKALMDVLDDIRNHQAYQDKYIRLKTFQHNIIQSQDLPLLAVPAQQSWKSFSLSEILYISHQEGLALLGLHDTQLLTEKSFQDYLRLFTRQTGFIQIHPKHVVQSIYISHVDTDRLEIIMNNSITLPVSAHKLQTLLRLLS